MKREIRMEMITKAVLLIFIALVVVESDGDLCRRTMSKILVCERWSNDGDNMMKGIEMLKIKRCADNLSSLKLVGPKLRIVIIDICHITCDDVLSPTHLTLTINGKKCQQDIYETTQTSSSNEDRESTDATSTPGLERETVTTVIENILIGFDKSWMIVALISLSLLLIVVIVCCVKTCRKCENKKTVNSIESRNYQLLQFDVESLIEMDIREFNKRD